MPKDKRYVLRGPDGATIVARSREGHDDCELLGTVRGDPPDDHRWSDESKRFVACPDATARRDRHRLHTLACLRRELDEALARIARLEELHAATIDHHPQNGEHT